MEDKFLQQIKKGVLELLVLGFICGKPAYGYELLALLDARSDGLFALKEGTLYPVLYRLEDGGLIQSAWQQGAGRAAPKKVYTATAAGRSAFAARREKWGQLCQTTENMLQGVQTDEGSV